MTLLTNRTTIDIVGQLNKQHYESSNNPLLRYSQTQLIQNNSQQQVRNITRSTQRRRNYGGGKWERDKRSTKFKVSRLQQALSYRMDHYRNPGQDCRKEKQKDSN
ncbi:unnamed protein product [Schistosoma rodhaini]|uniref:Uncharacterized protein n=1 Tax=Schistosoma rodhaini TaxID=6188 RepID=A0A183RVD2_9TREM|nr:unnamed protein product [Schistosoma rodhaini]